MDFLGFQFDPFKHLNAAVDPHHIPTVAHLNAQITPRTGWHIEGTVVRYTLADDWYKKFAARIFMITDYLRTVTKWSSRTRQTCCMTFLATCPI
jgi:hypothetical protein